MKNTIEYKGYVGSVQLVEKDKLLYGKKLGINALISYEGSSVEDALRIYLNESHTSAEAC